MEVLLDLNFYCNFYNVLKTYTRNDIMMIHGETEKYMKSLLNIKSWEEMSISKLEVLKSGNMIENILKYSLLHHGREWKILKDEQSRQSCINSVQMFGSNFINLIIQILTPDDKVDFNIIFNAFLDGLPKSFRDEVHLVLKTDFSILIQTAYLCKYDKAFEAILSQTKIDIECITIPILLDKNIPTIIAECGYNDLLVGHISKKMSAKTLYELYKSCLKGNQDYSTNGSNYGNYGKKEGFSFTQDYEKCFALLIEHDVFKEVVAKESPMHEALLSQNNYATNKLMTQFGLTNKFLENLDYDHIKNYLDSHVEENPDKSGTTIDYKFMETWGPSLLTAAKSSETRLVITHPVIRIFVEFMMKQFGRLFIINLSLYLVFYVLPFFFGFVYNNFVGYLISFIYLLGREIFQYIFIRFFGRNYNSEMNELFWKQETLKFNQKFDFGKFVNTYFRSKVNLFETLLIILTLLTTISLFLATHFQEAVNPENKNLEQIYRLMLVVTILMSAIELSILTTSVFSKQGIYMVGFCKV
jgi:hypothetical protein